MAYIAITILFVAAMAAFILISAASDCGGTVEKALRAGQDEAPFPARDEECQNEAA